MMMHQQFMLLKHVYYYTTCIFVHIPDSVYFLCAHILHIFHRVSVYCTHCTQRHNSCQASDIENSLHNYPTIVHKIGDEGARM